MLREQWQHARDYQAALFAGIQTTLHNKWYERSDGRRFLASDFMPERKPSPAELRDNAARTLEERIEDQKLAILAALDFAAAANGVN